MHSSTLFFLLTVFLVALTISVSASPGEEGKKEEQTIETTSTSSGLIVHNAIHNICYHTINGEKGEKKGKEGESKEGGEGEGGEGEKKVGAEDKKEESNGATSLFSSSGFSAVVSLAIASLILSIH